MSDRHSTRNQIVCDDCGRMNMRGLQYRSDFGSSKRLCSRCATKHDNHPQVISERQHIEVMDSADHDDF